MSRTSKNTTRRRTQLRIEPLEPRSMMAADVDSNICYHGDVDLDHPDEFPAIVDAATAGGTSQTTSVAKSALSAIPQLSSLPSARAKLVLDFDGNTLARWGGKTNVVTPAYDIDGDPKTFSVQEIANIREIWARVAEDYAPFNIDVTTIDPGQLTDRVVAKIVIGGSSFDWYGKSAGGVAYIGGFANASPNVGFAFAKDLGNGNARYTADAASHEAGHLFGLDHQAQWSGTKLVTEYNQGNANWAPIMGVGYYAAVTTWSNGPSPRSSTALQDDMSIIAGSQNGFGYRTNSQGSSATAKDLGTTGTVSVSGVIAKNTDRQWWKFTTSGGGVALDVNVATVGANLDSVLEIRNQSGTLLYSANASTTLNSTLRVSLNAGTYYAVVRSTGIYGYVGQYTLTGSFPKTQSPPPPPPPATTTGKPQIAITDGTTRIISWTTQTSLGRVNVGSYVSKTFTIRNDGNAPLTVQSIDLPKWLTIVSNISASSLQAGATTKFTVRFNPATAGTYTGVLNVRSNDAATSRFAIQLGGIAVTAPVAAAAPANSIMASSQTLALIDLVMSELAEEHRKQ